MKYRISLIVLLIIFIPLTIIHPKQKIPLLIKNQNKIFKEIAKSIQSNFPPNIKILIYKSNLLNGQEGLKEKLNRNFHDIITSLQTKYKYSIIFEEEISKYHEDIDLKDLKKKDELELIALGNFLEQDVVMLSSITIIEEKNKLIFDKTQKKWLKKKVALFQGNFFNENRNSLLRFSYYFLIE